MKARLSRRAIGPARTVEAGEGDDGSVPIDGPDAVVVGVRNDQTATAIDGDTDGPVETCVVRGAVAIARHTVTGVGRHATVRGEAPDGVVARVSDEERAARVDRHS